jgi:dipeptidase
VKGIRSISNGLTIGNRFDKASPNLIKTAIKRGWCSSEKDFDFADCYSDWFFTTFSMCRARKDRTTELLAAVAGKITPAYMMSFLRDHGDEGKGEFLPHKGLFMNKVCMHAANGLSRGSQSTASLVSHLTGGINTHWYTGTSAPCTSIFKPFYFESGTLPDLGPEPKETYDEKTLWWRHERLHRATLLDYQNRMKLYAYKRDKIEGEFIDRSATLAKEVAKKGVDAAKKSLGEFSQKCFDATVKAEEEWTKKVLKAETPVMLPGLFSGYWKKQSRKAKMPE